MSQSTPVSLSKAAKYERLAFTFCKVGTVGLLAWLLSPQVLTMLVALIAIALYGRAFMLGIARSRCFLRKPLLIMGFWAVIVVIDAAWLFIFHLGR